MNLVINKEQLTQTHMVSQMQIFFVSNTEALYTNLFCLRYTFPIP